MITAITGPHFAFVLPDFVACNVVIATCHRGNVDPVEYLFFFLVVIERGFARVDDVFMG